MKRQFDAACRQYGVKQPKASENLWTNNISWPSQGVTYDAKTQTYEIPAGTTHVDLNVYDWTDPIPSGTTISVSVFFESGYYDASRTALYIGGLNGQNSWQAYSGGGKAQDLTGKIVTKTLTTTAPITRFAIILGNYSALVSEPIRFRVMFVIADTPASEFEPSGVSANAWADGIKCGLPSVKMLGKTEQQTYTEKNLFHISGRERVDVPWGNNDSVRTFSGNGIYVGLTSNNYSNIDKINASINDDNQEIVINQADAGYGVGVDFNLDAGGTYSCSIAAEDNAVCSASFYDETGNWLSSAATARSITFTVPENAYWTIILLRVSSTGAAIFREIQLEKGSVATEYEPYWGGYLPPNVQYPVDIKVNNATVRSFGTNLFNTLAFSTTAVINNTHISSVSRDEVIVTSYEGYNGNGYVNSGVALGTLAPGLVIGKTYILFFDTESSRNFFYLPIDSLPWYSGKPLTITENHLKSIVCIYGFDAMAGEEPGVCRISNIRIVESGADTAYEPYFDGGSATTPDLLFALDGSHQSTYDSQTGEFVNWWDEKRVYNGSEDWQIYTIANSNWDGFMLTGQFSTDYNRNPYWSNQFFPLNQGQVTREHPHLWCGFSGTDWLAVMADKGTMPFYDDSLADKGLANWKAHLAEHPLEVWVAKNEPEITNIGVQRLTCPMGYGQIVQVAGDIPDCPLKIKYLSHGGKYGTD